MSPWTSDCSLSRINQLID